MPLLFRRREPRPCVPSSRGSIALGYGCHFGLPLHPGATLPSAAAAAPVARFPYFPFPCFERLAVLRNPRDALLGSLLGRGEARLQQLPVLGPLLFEVRVEACDAAPEVVDKRVGAPLHLLQIRLGALHAREARLARLDLFRDQAATDLLRDHHAAHGAGAAIGMHVLFEAGFAKEVAVLALHGRPAVHVEADRALEHLPRLPPLQLRRLIQLLGALPLARARPRIEVVDGARGPVEVPLPHPPRVVPDARPDRPPHRVRLQERFREPGLLPRAALFVVQLQLAHRRAVLVHDLSKLLVRRRLLQHLTLPQLNQTRLHLLRVRLRHRPPRHLHGGERGPPPDLFLLPLVLPRLQ